ncbi:MAG: bacillithiol biosynthesis cysteine-adding enzyme BshC [Flavobacteriales bacterium]
MEGRCFHIPYEDTRRFSRLLIDYVQQAEKLKPYMAFSPDIDGLQQAIEERKNKSVNRSVLVETMLKQYNHLLSDEDIALQIQQIHLLRNDNTFTITTGQQTGIFLGPLYTLLKAITVIKLSRQLKAQLPKYDFVPVFWLASEDHDKEEINHLWIRDQKFVWQTEQEGAVGQFKTEGLSDLVCEVTNFLGKGNFHTELIKILNKAYSKTTLADATFYILHCLLSHEGLLVLNPDDADLKKLFIPILHNEVLEQNSIHALNKQTTYLAQHYSPQITGREINLFYLSESGRSLISEINSKSADREFACVDIHKKWNAKELLNEIDSHPENFSPNVVLRPVYQETILPNIAYVGGAAEVAYWMQLKGVFEANQTFFPVIIPRNSVGFISTNSLRKLDKMNLNPIDLFKDKNALIKSFLIREKGEQLLLKEEHLKLSELLAGLKLKAETTDITLSAAAEALHHRWQRELNNFSQKLLRAEKRKEQDAIRRIDELLGELFPQGKLQERHHTLLSYFIDYGHGFIKMLLQELDPLDGRFVLIELSK